MLDRRDLAAATARRIESLSFKGTSSNKSLTVEIDVTVTQDIRFAFAAALNKFGQMNVVVNNAGHGLAGPFEELFDAQIKTPMDINFFDLITVTKKVIGHERSEAEWGTDSTGDVNWRSNKICNVLRQRRRT